MKRMYCDVYLTVVFTLSSIGVALVLLIFELLQNPLKKPNLKEWYSLLLQTEKPVYGTNPHGGLDNSVPQNKT